VITMRNFWKQFGASVIRSKGDPFVSVRLKLTGLYIVSLVVVAALVYLLIGTSSLTEIGLVLIIFATAIGYFLSSRALGPIRHMFRAQRRFIADASHELRTPLSIMKTNSEVALMEGSELKAEEAIETLTSNMEEIDRMSKLIEQLLSMSFYDNRMIEIPSAPVNFSQVVSGTVDKIQSLARQKNVKLIMEKADPLTIVGNPTALEQLVMNLVKNAIVYTPSGGKVHVSVERDGKQGRLNVEDTGIGISPEDLPNVFNPFYKTDKAARMSDGTGLGLTIVKKIVERHNGSIDVESEPGKGTHFTVSLPAA
jgi:signal transduction histidine kinase